MMTRGSHTPIPQRLSNEEFFSQHCSPVRIYRNVVREPVSVHWHEFYEIHFIVCGQGIHQLNGNERQIGPGTLFLLTPTDFHALISQADRPLELLNVIFVEEVLGSEVRHLLFRQLGEELQIQLGEEARASVAREFEILWKEAEEQQHGYQLVMRGALERICVLLRRNVGGDPVPLALAGKKARSLFIHQALLYIQHHFREPLSLLQVASHVGLSSHYFSECFHKATGQTFQEHLQDVRIRFAHSLLGRSQLPVTTICSSAGFTSLTHFERVFKRRFGVSPHVYQQRSVEPRA